jgi:microcystin-dependent protein
MKRLLLLSLILFNSSFLIHQSALAQAPGKFKYQAVVRDANGAAVQNENVNIRFQIYNAPAGGTVVYQEDFPPPTGGQPVNTGNFGVVNLEVGGSATVGDLATLEWGSGAYYANIQMRPASGGTYADISDTRAQLVSVPYALYAASAGATGQPVSITGAGATTVTGSFPSFTVSSTDENTTYTAGAGIAISGSNVISNSAPNTDQNLTLSGNTLALSGSTPASVTLNFTVNGSEVSLNGTPVFTVPNLTPAGTIVAFGGTTAPAGWVMCDGASYSTGGQYANLFAAIGSAFGGSGNNFNVPDFRGRFLRGHDGSADRDPDKASRTAMNLGGLTGNNVGSVQGDAFQGHWHQVSARSGSFASGSFFNLTNGYSNGSAPNGAGSGEARNIISDNVNGTPRVSSETRPVNAYVNYIIKL